MDQINQIKFLILGDGNNLKHYLNKYNNFEVFSINFNSLDAYKKITELKPDVILLEQTVFNSK